MSPVRVERRGIALHVLLTRPERRNALTQWTMEALLAAFREAARSDARAVVLRGEGGQFSAGGDMSMLGAIPPPADPDPLFPLYRRMGHVLELLNALPQACHRRGRGRLHRRRPRHGLLLRCRDRA